MSMVIGCIITPSYWGVCTSFVLIVAHGLCSSDLFCLSNFFTSVVVDGVFWLIKV